MAGGLAGASSSHAAAPTPARTRPLDPPPEEDESEKAASVSYLNSVGFSFKLGTDQYSEQVVSGDLAFSPVFKVLLSADLSQVSGTSSSNQFTFGTSWKPTDPHSLRFSYAHGAGNLPILSRSWGLTYAFELSSLWHGNQRLEASFGYHSIKYVGGGASANELFSQTGLTGELRFQPFDFLEISFNHTTNSYPALTSIAQTYLRVVTLALALHPELLPEEQVTEAALTGVLGDSDRITLGVSATKSVQITELSYAPSLEFNHDFNNRWEGGLSLSSTASSGTNPSTQGGASILMRF